MTAAVAKHGAALLPVDSEHNAIFNHEDITVDESRFYCLVPLGGALLITPFLFEASTAHAVASVVIGVLIVALSFRRGSIREHYGSWDRYIV